MNVVQSLTRRRQNKVVIYDGRKAHEVTDFEGERFSLVFFMRKNAHEAGSKRQLFRDLKEHGFPAPGTLSSAQKAMTLLPDPYPRAPAPPGPLPPAPGGPWAREPGGPEAWSQEA